MADNKRKRSSSFSKSYKRARRMYKRSQLKGVVPRMRIKRYFFYENWAFNTTSTPGFRKFYAPDVNSVTDFNQYQVVFDQYKVHRITITLCPRFQATTSFATAGATVNNQFYVTLGQDVSQDIPAGTYNATQYNRTFQQTEREQTFMLDKVVRYSWKPYVSRTLGTAGGSIGTIPCPWINTASGQEPMLGCQAFLHDANFAGANAQGFSVDVFFEFDMELRGQK